MINVNIQVSENCFQNIDQYPHNKIETFLMTNFQKYQMYFDATNTIRDTYVDRFSHTQSQVLCNYQTKYLQPMCKRAIDGSWMWIVNHGQYTQTVESEICLK